MKLPHFASRTLIALALSSTLSTITMADEHADVNLPVTQIKYFATGIGPLMAAPGHGDMLKGAHATFVKFPAGFVGKVHTHTLDYYGVVISGVVINKTPDGVDVPLPAGSYWFQKGKEAHVTNCISANECVVFVSQMGKFDALFDSSGK